MKKIVFVLPILVLLYVCVGVPFPSKAKCHAATIERASNNADNSVDGYFLPLEPDESNTVHLFANIPFGASVEVCEQTMQDEHNIGMNRDPNIPIMYVAEEKQPPFEWLGIPVVFDMVFIEDGLSSVGVGYYQGAYLDECTAVFVDVLRSMQEYYGNPTDAYINIKGEYPIQHNYFFPTSEGNLDLMKGIEIIAYEDRKTVLMVCFGNVVVGIGKSYSSEEAVYSVNAAYDAEISMPNDRMIYPER